MVTIDTRVQRSGIATSRVYVKRKREREFCLWCSQTLYKQPKSFLLSLRVYVCEYPLPATINITINTTTAAAAAVYGRTTQPIALLLVRGSANQRRNEHTTQTGCSYRNQSRQTLNSHNSSSSSAGQPIKPRTTRTRHKLLRAAGCLEGASNFVLLYCASACRFLLSLGSESSSIYMWWFCLFFSLVLFRIVCDIFWGARHFFVFLFWVFFPPIFFPLFFFFFLSIVECVHRACRTPCVSFTLNCSFYPQTSGIIIVRADSSIPETITGDQSK